MKYLCLNNGKDRKEKATSCYMFTKLLFEHVIKL